jgi:hypothetical protein
MKRLMLTCALAALPLAGCDIFGPDNEEELEELRANRAKWEQIAPASYSYVLQRSCFCGTEMSAPVRITVVNGVRQSAVYVESGAPMRSDWLHFFPTMEGLFDMLEEEIREADEIEITYDAARGNPTLVSVDAMENAIDDEYGLTISQVNLQEM